MNLLGTSLQESSLADNFYDSMHIRALFLLVAKVPSRRALTTLRPRDTVSGSVAFTLTNSTY